MQMQFTVHSVVAQPVTKDVVFQGKTVSASIAGLVVELVAADGSMATLRFTGEDVAAAQATFQQDSTITVDFGVAPTKTA